MKLEIGSGNNPTEGFEHLDINPGAPHVEYVGDIRSLITEDYNKNMNEDLMLLKHTKFECIKAVHFIEHIQWIYQQSLLRLFYDMLEPNGTVYIETPDLKWIMLSYLKNRKKHRFPVEDHPDIKEDGNLLNFYQWVNFKLYSGCSPGDYHHCLYDKEFLNEMLNNAGFAKMSIKSNRGTIFCMAKKPATQEKGCNEDFYKSSTKLPSWVR